MTGKRKDETAGGPRSSLITLRQELCRACTHCIRVCPTEAIRVRGEKAEIMPHRCIDCGECLRACPREAWTVKADPLPEIENNKSWAVLDPAVFGQFGGGVSPERVVEVFGEVGFPAVKDMGEGMEIYRGAVAAFLCSRDIPLPAISSDCPAVVDLIRVKFPSLLENLVPIVPPYEITAQRAKQGFPAGSAPVLSYIVPCTAKARAAAAPLSADGGYSGAIPFADLYNSLSACLRRPRKNGPPQAADQRSSSLSLEWSFSGGETRALGMGATLVVDGIHNVAEVLELAENGLLEKVPFIEAWSCPGGCLGGPLNVQNPFWARFHMLSLIRERPSAMTGGSRGTYCAEEREYRLPYPFQAREGMRLDADLLVAMDKLRRIDEVARKFPGIDCGSCGCPTCLALAEDVVQGYASEGDCIYEDNG